MLSLDQQATHKLVRLHAVFLQASDPDDYRYAQENPLWLRECLARLVLRRSASLSCDGRRFALLATEPVPQGSFDPHSTKITLLGPSASRAPSQPFEDPSAADDELDIEPDFLARCALPTAERLSLRPFPLHAIGPLEAVVRTSTLSRLGVCASDWVILASSTARPLRLLQIAATDDRLLPIDGLGLSPLLIHLHPHPEFTLTPCAPPSFPIIRSLTLARLASPHQALKQLQPVFLNALAHHFREKSRILQLGDLVPIPIDARLARFQSDLIDDLDLDLGPPQTVIYFKVTQLDLFPAESHDPPPSHLGGKLDPQITKLIQSGLSPPGTIPDLTQSLGIPSLPPSELTPLERGLKECLAATLARPSLPRTILLTGPRGVGKSSSVCRAATSAGFQLLQLSAFALLNESEAKTMASIEALIERVCGIGGPVLLLFTQVEALGRKSQTIENGGREPQTVRVLAHALSKIQEDQLVFVVATTSERDKMSPGLESIFKRIINFLPPESDERTSILSGLLSNDNLGPGVMQLLGSSGGTASLVAKDLVSLSSKARSAGTARVLPSDSNNTIQDILNAGGLILSTPDFATSLQSSKKAHSTSLGAPTIPDVRWEDIGGLDSVKDSVLETLMLPIQRPELFCNGLRKRSGILLFGPPGTGKTLVAKAIATTMGMNFISVKGPELLDMYIGESESKVRKVFERARSSKPTIIFFDELDSLAPRRGNQGDSGGVMDRIVSQLLAELDGIGEGVYVLGATNRPDLLEPGLLRPGRFEKLVYLGGLEGNAKGRLDVMKALTRKMKLEASVDLEQVVGSLRSGIVVTGADLYSICSEAMMRSMTRLSDYAESQARNEGTTIGVWLDRHAKDLEIVVGQDDLMGAAKDWVGSVSVAEMEHYRAAQIKFTREGSLIGQDEVVVVGGGQDKGKGRAVE